MKAESKTYTHKQETWDEKKCAAMAKRSRNGGPRGIIASSASSYPEYGQTIRFNGGRVIDGEWYESEAVPLPNIPDSYEFVNLVSWGTVIRKKLLK